MTKQPASEHETALGCAGLSGCASCLVVGLGMLALPALTTFGLWGIVISAMFAVIFFVHARMRSAQIEAERRAFIQEAESMYRSFNSEE